MCTHFTRTIWYTKWICCECLKITIFLRYQFAWQHHHGCWKTEGELNTSCQVNIGSSKWWKTYWSRKKTFIRFRIWLQQTLPCTEQIISFYVCIASQRIISCTRYNKLESVSMAIDGEAMSMERKGLTDIINCGLCSNYHTIAYVMPNHTLIRSLLESSNTYCWNNLWFRITYTQTSHISHFLWNLHYNYCRWRQRSALVTW